MVVMHHQNIIWIVKHLLRMTNAHTQLQIGGWGINHTWLVLSVESGVHRDIKILTAIKQIHDVQHGPLTRYLLLRVAHVPGMPGTFSPPPRVSDSDMHHGTCVKHVPWCMPGSLTTGFLWIRWRAKCSRHSPRMRNLQFCWSGKRPMGTEQLAIIIHEIYTATAK